VSRDGRTLLTGDWNGTLQHWEAGSGRALGVPLLQTPGSFTVVALSPDERTIFSARMLSNYKETPTARADANRFWDAVSWQPLGYLHGHQEPIGDAAFSPAGRLIVPGGGDGPARLWDAATRQPAGVPLPHEGQIGTVGFSPEARLVVVGSDDGRAKVW